MSQRNVLIKDDNGKPVAIEGIVTDRTQELNAKDKLMESENKFRHVLGNVQLIGIMLDVEGNLSFCNDYLLNLTGWKKEEILGKNWFETFVPLEISHEIKEIFLETISGREMPSYHENEIVTKSGERKLIAWNNTASMDKESSIVSITSIGEDITERKRAHDALINAKIKAEEANRTKSEFLANMSHELRTPLNSIIGFSEVLLAGMTGELTDKQDKYVHNISKSGRHLLELINSILDISKIEAGKAELYFEEFEICEVLDEILTQMTPIAISKNISMDISCEPEKLKIYADYGKVKQICLNVISNSLKFTPENGSIEVFIKHVNSEVEITVKDSGIGIPKNKQGLVFEPFEQADSSSSRKFGGTGLGLSLVKKFIELHGGRVILESEEGKGTILTLSFPDRIKQN